MNTALLPLDVVLKLAHKSREEVQVPVEARVGGNSVIVTAVLERTVVYEGEDGERRLTAFANLQVDPTQVRWRRVSTRRRWSWGREPVKP